MGLKSRYPGVNSFKEGDHDIFCGRKNDTEELLRKIIINNTVVLHGESGKGKSSLVQAGLLHELEKYNADLVENGRMPYIPLVIKMDQVIRQKEGEEPDKQLLVKFIIDKIKNHEKAGKAIGTADIPYLPGHPDNLWYVCKQCERAGYCLLLVLDQFEELQTYTTDQVDALGLALSEIFIFRMPQAFYQEFNQNIKKIATDENTGKQQAMESEVLAFLEQPLSVRLLFVIREDRLGVMSLLNMHFPGILKNDYLLKPLSTKDARMAISVPCQTDGTFSSEKFVITPDATEELLRRLQNKDTPGFYDPIELQIICSNIERKRGNKTSITDNDLPKVENAIKEFYDAVWTKAQESASLNHKHLDRLKKKMIKELVVNGKRNLALKDTLTEKKEGSEEKDENAEKVLQTLKLEGLVREIPGEKKATYFQLCHDRFIEAAALDIQQAAEARAMRKRRSIALIVLGSILLLIGGSSWFSIRQKRRAASDERTWILMKMLQRRNNPTLAYLTGKDWFEGRSWATSVKNELAVLDSAKGVFLKGIYPFAESVINVILENDSLLRIDEGYEVYSYNASAGLLIDNPDTTHRGFEYMGKTITTGRDILMYKLADSSAIIFKDQSGKYLGKFINKEIDTFTDAEEVFVSPGLKYIYIEGKIYNISTGKPVGDIETTYPVYSDTAKKAGKIESYVQLSSVAFFRDDTLAAGYSDGSIRTYKVAPSRKKMLPTVDSFLIRNIEKDVPSNSTISSAELNTEGNKITAMTTDRTGRFLYVTSQFNSVLIYDFEKLKKPFAKDPENPRRNRGFAGELKGHLSQVVSVNISPDNKFIVTGSYDHYLILWDATDASDPKKISDFRTPYGEKLTSTWFVNNTDIFSLSEDKNLYWWKFSRPNPLYLARQLYRFSPFVYQLNLLSKQNYYTTPAGTTTKEQYKNLVNYLVSIPDDNPFPADNMYNTLLKEALPDINLMYRQLVSMPDYEKEITIDNRIIMEGLYIKLINGLDDLTGIEKDLLTAKHRIPAFQFKTDTTLHPNNGNAGISFSFFSLTANRYLGRGKDLSHAFTYLRYTKDSLFPLILPKLRKEQREYALSQVDLRLIKYYTYSGKYDSAVALAEKGIASYESGKIAFMYYKIPPLLAAGKYDEAKKEFEKSELEKKRYKRTLEHNLNQLLERNIAAGEVRRFMKEVNLREKDKDDENND